MSKFKFGIGAVVATLMLAFGAFSLGNAVPTADADIVDVFVSVFPFETDETGTPTEEFTDRGSCEDMPPQDDPFDTTGSTVGTVVLRVGQRLAICVDLTEEQGDDGTDSADVTFDSNEVGAFRRAICANNDGDGDWFEFNDDDDCVSTEGINTDELIVDCAEQPGNPPCDDGGDDPGGILVVWQCPTTPASTTITIVSSDAEAGRGTDTHTFNVQCRGNAGNITVTATPTTVEIIPAASNTAHSLIQVTVTDSAGTPILIAPTTDVDFSTDRCAIEESNVDTAGELEDARRYIGALLTADPDTYAVWDEVADFESIDGDSDLVVIDSVPGSDNSSVFDFDTSGLGVSFRSMAAAVLHCDPHAGVTAATPGVAQVTVCIEVPDAADICRGATVTVIGPPASITVAASPTSLRCGEKATITVTVKDAIGQNVSDHTMVELVSNLGSTIGGTGAVASFAGPVVPISSSVSATFGGVATAFLLTSESHSGPYEVVATSGGSHPQGIDTDIHNRTQTLSGGIFSTPPISAQATVTCTIPAPTVAAPAATVTAPRTGTGIVPPNTGDAGLASSSSSWTLFAIGGIAAFALAGLATLKFARR